MKEQLKNEVQSHLNRVRGSLQKAQGSQIMYKIRNEQNETRRKFWAKDIVDTQAENLRVTYENEITAHRQEALDAFEKAMAAAKKRGEYLDVNDQKLTNAMRLIQEMGSNLTDEEAGSINSQFAGDQSSLKALKLSYQKAGIAHNGLIDTLMYDDFDRAWARGRSSLYTEMMLDGYVNSAGQAVAKIAKLEGLEFDPVIDKSAISTREQIRAMSNEQVNQNWDEISRFMANA